MFERLQLPIPPPCMIFNMVKVMVKMVFSDFYIFGVILAKIATKNPLIFALIATKIRVVFNIIVCKFTQTCGRLHWHSELICSNIGAATFDGKKTSGVEFFEKFSMDFIYKYNGIFKISKIVKMVQTDFQKSTR